MPGPERLSRDTLPPGDGATEDVGVVAGGVVVGEAVAGEAVAGGDVAGGDVAGGDVAGGDVAGGDVAGGDVAGGDVAGAAGSVGDGTPAGVADVDVPEGGDGEGTGEDVDLAEAGTESVP